MQQFWCFDICPHVKAHTHFESHCTDSHWHALCRKPPWLFSRYHLRILELVSIVIPILELGAHNVERPRPLLPLSITIPPSLPSLSLASPLPSSPTSYLTHQSSPIPSQSTLATLTSPTTPSPFPVAPPGPPAQPSQAYVSSHQPPRRRNTGKIELVSVNHIQSHARNPANLSILQIVTVSKWYELKTMYNPKKYVNISARLPQLARVSQSTRIFLSAF